MGRVALTVELCTLTTIYAIVASSVSNRHIPNVFVYKKSFSVNVRLNGIDAFKYDWEQLKMTNRCIRFREDFVSDKVTQFNVFHYITQTIKYARKFENIKFFFYVFGVVILLNLYKLCAYSCGVVAE